MAEYLGPAVDLSGDRTESARRRNLYDTRANEAYDFGKAQGTDTINRANQVSDQALDTSKSFADYAKADRGLFDSTVVPGLKQQFSDAQNWDSAGNLSQARGEAGALNTMAFSAAGDAARRQLEGVGVDPSAGRYAGLDTALASRQATSGAGAMNQAANQRKLQKQALLAQANQMGLVLPGQAVNEAGVSLAGGNAAENAKIAGGDAYRRWTDPSGWVGVGDAAHDDIRNSMVIQTQLDQAQQRLAMEQQKADAAGSSGIGALLGGAMSIGGSLLGGPLGGMAGGMLGNMMGGAMGGGGVTAGAAPAGGYGGYSGYASTLPGFEKGGPVKKENQAFTPDVPHMEYGGALGIGDPITELFSDDDDLASQDSGGEGVGRGIGGTVGSILGSIWGPIGSVVGEELLGRIGSAGGAAIEGKWGEAGGNLIEGSPLDLLFDDGGSVPEDEFDMPEEGPTPGVVPTEASPSGGEATDDVHAMLNEGEFVIPKEVVRWNGEKFFQKLIEKSKMEMQGPQVAEPEYGPATAVAMSPPSFQTTGQSTGA